MKKNILSGLLVLAAFTAFWYTPHLTAFAYQDYIVTGDVVSLQVLTDRGTAQVYYQNGKSYIEGRRGERYTLRVRNNTNARVKAVVSVDGLSVISGEQASFSGPGYVIGPYGSIEIDGWRRSISQVASFTFSTSGGSYASGKGMPQNVGVIGVAAFKEDQPVLVATWDDEKRMEELSGSRYKSADRSGSQPGTSSASPASSESGSGTLKGRASSKPAHRASSDYADTYTAGEKCMPPAQTQNIGTGWGDEKYSTAEYTTFKCASSSPDSMISLYYDDYDGLVRRGVLPRPSDYPRLTRPEPFPESTDFCAPPKYKYDEPTDRKSIFRNTRTDY